MKQSSTRVLIFALLGILVLAACAPAAPAPTQDPAEIQKQIQDSVAATVAAQNAATEAAQALVVEPTNTPLPTQTEVLPLPTATLVVPTATPFVVVPPPVVIPSISGGGSDAPVNPEYNCKVSNQQPLDGSKYKPNKDFDIRWTITNTGTKSWPKGLDVKYFSGPEMTKVKFVELPAMAPGDSHEVILDAVSPSKQGLNVMTWIVEGKLCFPYVAITVE